MFLFAMLSACSHQYLAIPGAERVAGTVQYSYDQFLSTTSTTTSVFSVGSPALTTGSSATVQIDISAVVEFEVTEVVFLGLADAGSSFGDTWIWILSEEELANKMAEVEIFALDEKPKQEWCQRDYRGMGTCYQEADEGVTGLGVAAAGGEQTSLYEVLPITLDPIVPAETPDMCASFTVDSCCSGSTGTSATACYVSPPCGCPDGTGYGGVQGDGTTMCVCPV